MVEHVVLAVFIAGFIFSVRLAWVWFDEAEQWRGNAQHWEKVARHWEKVANDFEETARKSAGGFSEAIALLKQERAKKP